MGITRAGGEPIGRSRHKREAAPGYPAARLPRLWLQLPAEARQQLAQQVGQLLQHLWVTAVRSEEVREHADQAIVDG